jgi:hypothetical protein
MMEVRQANGRSHVAQNEDNIVEVARPSAFEKCSGLLCDEFLKRVCCDQRLVGKMIGV